MTDYQNRRQERLKRKEDELKFLSQTFRSSFDQRRQYEWKTFTATLTFYVLVTAATYSKQFALPNHYGVEALVWFSSLAIGVLSAIYLREIHGRNAGDKRIAFAAEDLIVRMCGEPSVDAVLERTQNSKSWLGANWSLIWQVVVIFAFAIVCARLVTIVSTERATCELCPKKA
jgi:hypothetical protein